MGDVNTKVDDVDDEERAVAEAKAAREATLAKLREKHGDVVPYEVPGFGLVVIAAPSKPAEYQEFTNNIQNEKMSKAISLLNFALACVVYPVDRESAAKIFRRWPAFATTVAGRGQKLCGSEIQELGKD